MKLIFEDNFNGSSLDRNKWRVITGGYGWGNNEDQFYVDNNKNIKVENGVLKIIALKEDYENRHYTSGKIETLQSFKYGRFEFVCKVPKGKGSWPAIWLLPVNKQGGWPLCGEIDVVETIGRYQDVMHYSLHTGAYNHKYENQRTFSHLVKGASDRFLTYALIWTKDYISFELEGKEVVRYNKNDKNYPGGIESWNFDQEFYIIVNLACGGNWGGTIDDDAIPFEFDIKSIKVFALDYD